MYNPRKLSKRFAGEYTSSNTTARDEMILDWINQLPPLQKQEIEKAGQKMADEMHRQAMALKHNSDSKSPMLISAQSCSILIVLIALHKEINVMQ